MRSSPESRSDRCDASTGDCVYTTSSGYTDEPLIAAAASNRGVVHVLFGGGVHCGHGIGKEDEHAGHGVAGTVDLVGKPSTPFSWSRQRNFRANSPDVRHIIATLPGPPGADSVRVVPVADSLAAAVDPELVPGFSPSVYGEYAVPRAMSR
jgi:hypothetical protein